MSTEQERQEWARLADDLQGYESTYLAGLAIEELLAERDALAAELAQVRAQLAVLEAITTSETVRRELAKLQR
jgi:ribosomal protein L29